MEPSKALWFLREAYLAGQHRLGEIFFYAAALEEITGGDELALAEIIRLLDEATPGRNFHVWLDGGRFGEDGWVYFYDRKPAEVAGVIGGAMLRAMHKEAA